MPALVGSLAPRTGGFFGALPEEPVEPFRLTGPDTMTWHGQSYRLLGDRWVADEAAQPIPVQPEGMPVQQVGLKSDIVEGLLKLPRDLGLSMGAADREARAVKGGFDPRTFYHGTERLGEEGTGLTEMPVTDIGVHLGANPTQANKRLEAIAGGTSENPASILMPGQYDEGANILPLRARLGKTLDMPDVGIWKDSANVARQLREQGFDVEDIFQDAMETKVQFEDMRDWIHSDENRRNLDDLSALLQSKGYNSIKYRNEAENEFGGATGLFPEAKERVNALRNEIDRIQSTIDARKEAALPVPPEGADRETVQKWVSARSEDYSTPEEYQRIERLRDQITDIRQDPANATDPHSYIILDPSRVRSTAAAFDPAQAESSNLLYSAIPAAAAGGGLTAGLMGSPGEAQAADNLLYSPAPLSGGQPSRRREELPTDADVGLGPGYGQPAPGLGYGGEGKPDLFEDTEPPMAQRLPAHQLRTDVVPPVSGVDVRPQQYLSAGPQPGLAERALTSVGFTPEEAQKATTAGSIVPGLGGAIGTADVADALRTGDVGGAILGAATAVAPFAVKPLAKLVKGGAGVVRRLRSGAKAQTVFERRAANVPETSILHPKRWPISLDHKARRYVGGPPGVDSPAKVEALAKRLADMAMTKEGIAGKDFYGEFQGVMRGMTDDPKRARQSGAFTALSSTSLGVDKNVEASNIIGNQLTLGVPVRAGRYPNRLRRKVRQLQRSGSDVPASPKFGRFATHMTPEEMREAGAPTGPVHDVHMMRAFSYPARDYDSGASDTNVAFMDAVFERTLEILNKNPKAIEKFGANPFDNETAQAAIWARQRHLTGEPPYPSAEALNEQAMVYAPVSAVPGQSAAPQLEPLRRASYEDKARYARAMTSPEEGGVSTQEVANLVGLSPEGVPGVGPWQDMIEPNEIMRIGGGTVGSLAAGKQRIESASFNIAKVATDWWQLGLGQEGAGLLFPKVLGKEARWARRSNLGQIHSDILRGGNIRGHKEVFSQLRELLGPDWSNKAFPMELPQARGGGFVLKKLPGASQDEFARTVTELSRRYGDEAGVGPTWMEDVATHNRGDYTFVDWQKMRGPGSFPRLLDRTLAHPNLARIFNNHMPDIMRRLHAIHIDQVKPYGLNETTLDRVRMTVRDHGLEGLVNAIKKGTLPTGAGVLVLALSPEVLHQARQQTVEGQSQTQ